MIQIIRDILFAYLLNISLDPEMYEFPKQNVPEALLSFLLTLSCSDTTNLFCKLMSHNSKMASIIYDTFKLFQKDKVACHSEVLSCFNYLLDEKLFAAEVSERVPAEIKSISNGHSFENSLLLSMLYLGFSSSFTIANNLKLATEVEECNLVAEIMAEIWLRIEELSPFVNELLNKLVVYNFNYTRSLVVDLPKMDRGYSVTRTTGHHCKRNDQIFFQKTRQGVV